MYNNIVLRNICYDGNLKSGGRLADREWIESHPSKVIDPIANIELD